MILRSLTCDRRFSPPLFIGTRKGETGPIETGTADDLRSKPSRYNVKHSGSGTTIEHAERQLQDPHSQACNFFSPNLAFLLLTGVELKKGHIGVDRTVIKVAHLGSFGCGWDNEMYVLKLIETSTGCEIAVKLFCAPS